MADSPHTWQGRPILAPEHANDLEQLAALHEFKHGLPRHEAEDHAHSDYRRDHHRQAAAFHLKGMRAAQAAGDLGEAKKHGAIYALHVKALGHDPYSEPPSEVQSLSQDEKQQKVYKFKAHKGDLFLLAAKGEEKPMEKSDKKPETPAQKLRKFWDEKHAQKDLQDVLTKIHKTAKEMLTKLSKSEDSAAEMSKEESTPAPVYKKEPHSYKAGAEMKCSECGEMEGHEYHKMNKSLPKAPWEEGGKYPPGYTVTTVTDEKGKPVTDGDKAKVGSGGLTDKGSTKKPAKKSEYLVKRAEARKAAAEKLDKFWKSRPSQEPGFKYDHDGDEDSK